MLSLLLALPGVLAHYNNGTTVAPSVSALAAAPSDDLTTCVTVELGKTITLVTRKSSATQSVKPASISAPVPPVAAASDGTTTYVTVKLGKTMTITTRNPVVPGVALANGAQGNGFGIVAAVAGAAAFFI